MKFLSISIGFWIATQALSAQAIVWNGGNGDWNVPSNWDCSCVPGISDSVNILNGIVTIPAGFPVFSELIYVSAGSALINLDTLEIANAGAEGLIVEGSFENHGRLRIIQALVAGVAFSIDAGVMLSIE